MPRNDLKLAGILLAAGGSSRLGEPKQLLEAAAETFVHRAARLALAVCNAGVVVVTGAEQGAVETALADLEVDSVLNPDWQQGMSASLSCGLAALSADAHGVLVMLCDQPRLDQADYQALADAWRQRPEHPTAASYAGVVGAPAIIPLSLCPALAAALEGDAGAGGWLRGRPDVQLIDLPDAACDIDTAADLREFLAR